MCKAAWGALQKPQTRDRVPALVGCTSKMEAQHTPVERNFRQQ